MTAPATARPDGAVSGPAAGPDRRGCRRRPGRSGGSHRAGRRRPGCRAGRPCRAVRRTAGAATAAAGPGRQRPGAAGASRRSRWLGQSAAPGQAAASTGTSGAGTGRVAPTAPAVKRRVTARAAAAVGRSAVWTLRFQVISIGCHPVSTPRSLRLPDRVRSGTVQTDRGSFAALEAQPGQRRLRAPARPCSSPATPAARKTSCRCSSRWRRRAARVVAIDLRGQYQSPARRPAAATTRRMSWPPTSLAIADSVAVGQRTTAAACTWSVTRWAASSPGSARCWRSRPDRCRSPCSARARQPSAASERRCCARCWPTARPAGRRGPGRPRRASRAGPAGMARTAGAAGAGRRAPTSTIIAFLRERTLRNLPGRPDRDGPVPARLPGPDRGAGRAVTAAPAVPVLVMYGENDDAWPPAAQDRMAKRLGAPSGPASPARRTPRRSRPRTPRPAR